MERHTTAPPWLSCLAAVAFATGFALVSGCAPYVDRRVPEPIRPIAEPVTGREYLLYRPSSYDPRLAWPLIIVCHGPFPDNAIRQLRTWTPLAESHGFLVVAPELAGVGPRVPGDAEAALQRRRADEDYILAVVNHLRGAHQISNDRVFIHGWAEGARPALYTGLRHPQLFRAISLAQPRCAPAYFGGDLDRVPDAYQPVYVNYGLTDNVTGKHGRTCLEWLRSIGADVREERLGSGRKNDSDRCVAFFENLIRKEPWIYIRVFPSDPQNPLAFQFKLESMVRPRDYHWQFGDGDESNVAAPLHVYAQAGRYRATVAIHGPDATPYRRTLDLQVP